LCIKVPTCFSPEFSDKDSWLCVPTGKPVSTTNFKFSLILLNDFCLSIARIQYGIRAIPGLLKTTFTQKRFAKQSRLEGAAYNGDEHQYGVKPEHFLLLLDYGKPQFTLHTQLQIPLKIIACSRPKR
jgi:hypothetical protein